MNTDFYKLMDMDASLILNYPSQMSGVLSATIEMLNSKGKLVADEGEWSVSKVRDLVSKRQDLNTYFLIRTSDPKIWSALREPISEDRVRVLGVVHGTVPDSAPDNVVVIDVGRSIQKRATPQAVSEITEIMDKRSAPLPRKGFEDKFYALQVMCYEALYSPEYRVFPKKLSNRIPRAIAFDTMFNPPSVPTEEMFRAKVLGFIKDVRG